MSNFDDVVQKELGAVPTARPYVITQYQFAPLHLPAIDKIVQVTRAHGVWALYRPDTVQDWEASTLLRDLFRQAYTDSGQVFTDSLRPNLRQVQQPFPAERFDFSRTSAASQYWWELFFYMPWLAAKRLSTTGQHEDADRWFRALFDPTRRGVTDGDPVALGPQEAWMTQPLVEAATAPLEGTDLSAWESQLHASMERPFEPHAIARVRPMAYQRAIFIDYVTNLLDWGDALFREDTREALGEATQLYFRVLDVLGPRPVIVTPAQGSTAPRSYRSLRTGTPAVPQEEAVAFGRIYRTLRTPVATTLPASLWGACISPNPGMLALWDRVEDRLFKLRNSLTLDGDYRELALFAPPIDPALLVRARAMGLDLGDVLALESVVPPPARFRSLLALAQSLSARVQGLGSALLAALEKGDAEHLQRVRVEHEEATYQDMLAVRQKQVEDAQIQAEVAERGLASARLRYAYYADLIKRDLLPGEILGLATQSLDVVRGAIAAVRLTAAGAKGVGDVLMGLMGGVLTGPKSIAEGMDEIAQSNNEMIAAVQSAGQLGVTTSSYQRRKEDWEHQKALAKLDRDANERQVKAAKVRLVIAQREVENVRSQIDRAREIRDFLTAKYTNVQLYSWMTGELRALYQDACDLALSVGRQCEAAFRRESGEDKRFLELSYAGSQTDALLFGERLQHDLHRMEHAFLLRRRPDHEFSRDIALSEVDPIALAVLRTTGSCFLRIEEAHLDLDAAGDWDRRLRGAAFTVACVKGAHQNTPLRARLVKSKVRRAPARADDLVNESGGLPVEVVLSGGTRDTGRLFDEPDRAGTFEGYGAITEWHLELPPAGAGFEATEVSDVVIHLQYTSRSGGDALRATVQAGLVKALATPFAEDYFIEGWLVGVSLAQQLPDAWYAWATGAASTLELPLTSDMLPVWLRGRRPKVQNVHVVGLRPSAAAGPMDLTALPPGAIDPLALAVRPFWQGKPTHGASSTAEQAHLLGTWTLGASTAPGAFGDLLLAFELAP
jgi:hypothetical protein